MKPVLYNYSKAVKPVGFYTKPKIMAHVNDLSFNIKTCIYKSPAIKASFVKMDKQTQYLDTGNYNSVLYYVINGNGTINDVEYNKGDVICTNEFSMIKSKNNTNLYCVEDAPLMDYYKVKQDDERKYILHYKNDVIMEEIESIENNIDKDSPNRLGVIFGTQESKTISKTLWCLMTKTLPGHVQPPHRHNSIALDYCVSGEGYTLFSKTINGDGSLHNPIKIIWNQGMVFVTPPGWWHSHHSTDDKPGYIFPVQDAGLHMYMDTLDIQFG